jgi:hypothetical protein
MQTGSVQLMHAVNVHPTAEYTVATGAGDTPPGSFLGHFRYATTFDWVLIGIATLCAMITGYCQIHREFCDNLPSIDLLLRSRTHLMSQVLLL